MIRVTLSIGRLLKKSKIQDKVLNPDLKKSYLKKPDLKKTRSIPRLVKSRTVIVSPAAAIFL